jgi:RimJ/RimL family protein N-acetyltransferase
LLARGRKEEALLWLRDASILSPRSPLHQADLLQTYAELALELKRPVEAGWALHLAQEAIGYERELPTQLLFPALVYHPVWHTPLTGRRVVLKRPVKHHLPFLSSLLADSDFVGRYNTFLASGQRAAEAFVIRSQQQPLQTRQLDWVIESAEGIPLGLACLADLDLENQRAELLVGFPTLPAMRQSMVEAALLVMVAGFAHLKLQKLVSYVYSDNEPAQAATLHLGFESEGLLRGHVRHRLTGRREDLHVNGLLRHEFFGSSVLSRHGRRTVSRRYPAGCLILNELDPSGDPPRK